MLAAQDFGFGNGLIGFELPHFNLFLTFGIALDLLIELIPLLRKLLIGFVSLLYNLATLPVCVGALLVKGGLLGFLRVGLLPERLFLLPEFVLVVAQELLLFVALFVKLAAEFQEFFFGFEHPVFFDRFAL